MYCYFCLVGELYRQRHYMLKTQYLRMIAENTIRIENKTPLPFRAVAKQLAKLHLTDYESVLHILSEADKIPMYRSRYRLSGFLPAIMPVLPERHEDPTKEKMYVVTGIGRHFPFVGLSKKGQLYLDYYRGHHIIRGKLSYFGTLSA